LFKKRTPQEQGMSERFQFNRMEFADSLGVMVVLLPMLICMILINGMDPTGLLVVIGGAVVGLFLGTHEGLPQLELGLNLPPWLPFGWPSPIWEALYWEGCPFVTAPVGWRPTIDLVPEQPDRT